MYHGNSIYSSTGSKVTINQADYTVTPVEVSGVSPALDMTTSDTWYSRAGRTVTVSGYLLYPATADVTANAITVLPFKAKNSNALGYASVTIGLTDSPAVGGLTVKNTQNVIFYKTGAVAMTNAELSGHYIYFTVTYLLDETVD
jgi:hypothetical protein